MAKYIVRDIEEGFVEDNAKIDYLKFNNLRHTIFGCMLGDFDEQGFYNVDPEIQKELIAMPKYIGDTMENMEICYSELKLDKQITFLVTFEEDKATLSLLEKLNYEANFKVNSGTYSNINEYVLDTIETSGEINRNHIYKRWNINQYTGNVIDIFSCDPAILEKYFGIVNRFKYLLQSNKILLEKEEELEEIEAEYANSVFEALKPFPEFEKTILDYLKLVIQEKQNFLMIDKPNFVKTFNEVLDNALLQHLDMLTPEQRAEFETALRNIYLRLNVKRSDLIEYDLKDYQNVVNDFSIKSILLNTLGVEQSQELSAVAAQYVALLKQIQERCLTNEINAKKQVKNLYITLQNLELLKKFAEDKKIEEKIKEEIKKEEAKKVEAKKAEEKKANLVKKAAGGAKKKAAKKSSTKPAAKKAPEKKDDKQETTTDEKSEEHRRRPSWRRSSNNVGGSQDNTRGNGQAVKSYILSRVTNARKGTVTGQNATNVNASGTQASNTNSTKTDKVNGSNTTQKKDNAVHTVNTGV